MAEIKIEKKKPVWPWILLVLIILGIIAYLVYNNNDEKFTDDYDDDVTNTGVMDSNDRPIQDRYTATDSSKIYDFYRAYEGSIMDSTRVAVDSSYTKKAFSNLAKAVVKTADDNAIEDSKALTDLREWSVLMTGVSSTNTDMENFKNFKTACDKVAKVLGDVQVKSYPELKDDVANLKKLASDVSPSVRMEKQQEKINAFLRKSRDVLNSMNP